VTLPYLGPVPALTGDPTIAPKSFADSQAAAATVTSAQLTTIVNAAVASMGWSTVVPSVYASPSAYVGAQNALLATQAEVIEADTAYVARALFGSAGGVAQLNGSAQLPTAQVPAGLLTNRIAAAYATAFPSASVGLLGGMLSSVTGAVGVPEITADTVVTSGAARTLLLARCSCPDPGYPWRPLSFGWVSGASNTALGLTGAQAGSPMTGNGTYGLLTVMPPITANPLYVNQIYGMGICTDSKVLDHYPVVPYAAANQTPTTVPAISGALELDLYGQLWSSSGTYLFAPTDLTYWVLQVPSL
jgi:hypothetical protein